jgi:sugar-specific transcriptional regulator TrmB
MACRYPQRNRDAGGMILGQLLAGAATAREIREGTGLPAPTVKGALRRLVRAESVTRSAGHLPRYQLAAS